MSDSVRFSDAVESSKSVSGEPREPHARELGGARVASSRAPGASLFPAFLKLSGRTCLVVGAGRIAESKIKGLLDAGAELRVVAPQASATVADWAEDGGISWAQREFQSADLDGAFLVVVATSREDVNERVYSEAQQRHVLCNVVDDPAHCDFYYPAVVRRGDLQIAISTNGQSPALAQRLRREFEQQFGPEYESWLKELGARREELFAQPLEPDSRRKLLHELASEEAFAGFLRRGQADDGS